MHIAHAVIAVAQAAVLGLLLVSDARAAPTTISVSLIGSSEKICQLTGDVDWETDHPTAARTLTNFGLDAVDLGYPIEHQGNLILLFGDSWPSHPGGPGGEVDPNDAVGLTNRTAPPTSDACLGLTIYHSATPAFIPATVTGPMKVKQGWFNVPSGGVSADGALNAFFWTNHCAAPQHLLPAPNDPLGRTSRDAACPETDKRNSIGSGVLARSDDEGRTFSHAVSMPIGFVYSTAVAAESTGVYVFGVPRFRASTPYLAHAPAGTFADPTTWQFFGGRTANGAPRWVSYSVWQRGRPPSGAEVLAPDSNADRCIGEFSVTWNSVLHSWLMLYNCGSAIEARIASSAWGPWSQPATLLSRDSLAQCSLMMASTGCGGRRNYWPLHKDGSFVAGGLYAPFVLNRYTTRGLPNAMLVRGVRIAVIYWLVSTWNPYEVDVMRATLESRQAPGS